MLATMLVHVPLVIAPLLQPAVPPECQFEVLTPMAIEERTIAGFNARIDAYLTLHRRVARTLPPFTTFDDEDSFFADELRSALVAARPGAGPGNFFTRPVAELFRDRIDLVLAYTGGSAIPFHPGLHGAGATVNQPLAVAADPIAWAPLLAVLSPLPPELAYAVAGTDLALVDVAANLVLDVIPDAVPAWPQPDVIYR